MKTQPARGMRDFLPDDVRRRQYVMGVVAGVYERYGFAPLETPAVENIETLLGKYGEEGDRLIFKILKRGEGAATGRADLALRYDLTVPLARVVAEHQATLPKFFKRYQMQPVWRADRPQKGRFREFYQCDVDAIGSRSMVVEAELLAAACEVLTRLGFSDFRVRLNHRLVLRGLLDKAGLAEDAFPQALVVVDKLDKIGIEGVRDELTRLGVSADSIAVLAGLFGSAGMGVEWLGPSHEVHNKMALAAIADDLEGSDDAATGASDLQQLLEYCSVTAAKGKVVLDLSLARGLSYYTGAIFEIAVPDLAGSLGGGGRYDHLIGMFLKRDVPACGISLGLERILVVMAERGMFPADLPTASADVLVAQWSRAGLTDVMALAAELRAVGLRVDVYPDADRLGRQFKYASACGIPFVAVLGDDEIAKGEVAIKDLRTGEQRAVARDAAGKALRTAMAVPPGSTGRS